jgi:hypothetical protein
MSEIPEIISEEKPQNSKPLKVTKAMEFLISKTVQDTNEKKSKKSSKKIDETTNEVKKSKKELEKEAKSLLNNCKGKTKDNKDCTRKESENCDGFCKQHFKVAKEKANTVELIEKHKK